MQTYAYDTLHSSEDAGNDKPGQLRQVDHQDYGHDDRSRALGGSGGFKKRLTPSEPSPHVIFLGLDPDFTEADVCRLFCFYLAYNP